MKNKEFIIGSIIIVLLYIVITISQVVIVAKTFEEQKEMIQQELKNSPCATESIQN